MRLNKFLAHAGIASRRKCDEIISSGKVKVNDNVSYDFSYQVTEDDCVRVSGEIVNLKDEKVVYLLNKPKGVISSVTDDRNRTTVMDFLPVEERLFPIGRLDRDTTGIILLTNDGDIANKLAHPKYCKEKKYFVKTKGKIEKKFLKIIKEKYILKDGTKVKADIKLLSHSGNIYEWNITLKEGKNREIKRIFSEFDAKVTMIHRYSFGGIELNSIKLGKYKKFKPNQLNSNIDK